MREVRGITGERLPFQVVVENHDVHSMEREKFGQEYKRMWRTRLDLTIDPMIKYRQLISESGQTAVCAWL